MVSDPPATERGDVAGVAVEALESGDDHDRPLVESLAQTHGSDIDDAGGNRAASR